MKQEGTLTVESENIFPIIKKWLYTEQDIFIRELISNGADAILKLQEIKKIEGTDFLPKEQINVIIDPENSTLKFRDNGLGMDAEEVDKYINQIAFSGVTDFFERYQNEKNRNIYSGSVVKTKI